MSHRTLARRATCEGLLVALGPWAASARTALYERRRQKIALFVAKVAEISAKTLQKLCKISANICKCLAQKNRNYNSPQAYPRADI